MTYQILKNHRQDVSHSYYDSCAHVFSPSGVKMTTLSAVSMEMPDIVRGFLARGNYVEVWGAGKLLYRGGPATPLTSHCRIKNARRFQ